MYGWKYGKGYDGKKIVLPMSIKMDKLDTEKKTILAFCEFGKASHFQAGGKRGIANGSIARKREMALADKVRGIFEEAGWHAHIFQTGSCDCRCDRLTYLHALCGYIEVSEVPFSKRHNIPLREEEMFDGENVRPSDDTLDRLRKRIGEPDISEAIAQEVSPKTSAIVAKIMAEEELADLHEIDEDARTFRSGAQEYTWRDDEDEAEEEARDSLMQDDEFWRQAVQAGNTHKGLKEWAQEVLDVDGWAHILCTYDGDYGQLGDGTVYWRVN
jgi:hypothetical protein